MFIDINSDLAEFIGIMLGDGNIYKNLEKWQYQIDISLNLIDEPKYVLHVENLMEKIFQKSAKVTDQHGKAVSLRYYSKEIVEFLLELGLEAGKKTLNQVKVPRVVFLDKEYIKSCLRGLFDTDGSIAIDNAKDLRISFSNSSKQLVVDFYNMSLNIGIIPSPKIKYSKKRKSWRVVIAKKDEINQFLIKIKPEKFKEPLRRIWLASKLIYLNSPENSRLKMKKRINQYLKVSKQSQFRYSRKNTLFFKNLCEEILKITINSDMINATITKVLTLEKCMYNKQQAQSLVRLFEKLRSAKRIVEYLIDCGELHVPHRQTITRHIQRYFQETKQNIKEWKKHNPSFRIGITDKVKINYFPAELRNKIISEIIYILDLNKNNITNSNTIRLLKEEFQKNDILIMTWMLNNPKYHSAFEDYLMRLVILCKRIMDEKLKDTKLNVIRLSEMSIINFNRKTISMIVDYLTKNKII